MAHHLAHDGAGGAGTLDREDRNIDVPDLTAPQVAISTPRVFRARTARRMAALAVEKEAYRGLVESASDIIYRTEPYGHFTFVNPVALRIMGFASEELLGKHFTDLVHPDCKGEAEELYVRQNTGIQAEEASQH